MFGFLKKLYSTFRDLTFGLHSNIPPCCVLYFLEEAYGMNAVERTEWSIREKREIGNTALPFVPCPDCREGEKYKEYDLHFCREHNEEFCELFQDQREEWMEMALEWRRKKREENGLQR